MRQEKKGQEGTRRDKMAQDGTRQDKTGQDGTRWDKTHKTRLVTHTNKLPLVVTG